MGVEETLYRLTAQEFEAVEDWEKWWDTVKDRFDPAKAFKDTEGTTGVVRRKRDGDNPEFGDRRDVAESFIYKGRGMICSPLEVYIKDCLFL